MNQNNQGFATTSPLDLDESGEKSALDKTRRILSSLNDLRKELDIPDSMVPYLLQIHSDAVRVEVYTRQMAAYEAGQRAQAPIASAAVGQSVPGSLRILSIVNGQMARVTPGHIARIVQIPDVPFRVTGIDIAGTRSHWRIHDVTVGDASQFLGMAPVSGEEIGKGGPADRIFHNMLTCQAGVEIGILVEYVGPVAEGEAFEANVSGVQAAKG